MRKTLTLILILALYASGVEAAAGYHEHADATGETALIGDSDDEHATDANDHCCHLAGHLLGIVIAYVEPSARERSTQPIQIAIDGYGRATAPPVPPPDI